VSDIQRRLAAVLPGPRIDPDGLFGSGTRAAVEAFQHMRGLRVDGMCGTQTWSTLVEAGFRLGDRLLYRRTPMVRGDDVADLQQRLCTLGFDTGRVDGIFGDGTAQAMGEFQRNAGLPVDGILGAATLRELLRLEVRHRDPQLVSSVRERAELRGAPPTLSGRHVAIGEQGGLGSTTGALHRRLALEGALVSELHHPDDAAQAQQANELGVDVFVGLRLNPDAAGCRSSFWSGTHELSPGGRLLAELVQGTVPTTLDMPDLGAHGMALPILRETRMPAVLIEIGPSTLIVERSFRLAGAISQVLSQWVDAWRDS
jgi:N-acetylmuramoyl-L-alanine amidase